MMNPKNFYYGLIAILVITVAGGGYGYFAGLTGTQTRAESLQKRLASEAVADERLTQLIELQRQYQKVLPLLPRFESAIPKSKKQSEITLQLQQLASANGMTLPSVTFQNSENPGPTSQTVKSGDLLALPINFALHGTYAQMTSFLKGLETLNRYTAIDSLSITRGSIESKALDFTVGLKVYFKP